MARLDQGGERPAVIWLAAEGTVRLSYAELADRAQRLAGGLRRAGVAPGERVALYAPNRPEWIAAALGVIAAGAVVVPLDVRLGKDALAHEIADSGCTRMFTVRERLDALHEALDGAAGLELYLLDADRDEGRARGWTKLLGLRPDSLPDLRQEDPAVLFYTSGTTGRPKGVPLSHGNLLSNLLGLREERLATPAERTLLPLPLHHVYPFMVGMLVVLDGGATIVLPGGVSGPEIARALREARVTSVIGVPRLYEALLSAVRRRVEARGAGAAALFKRLLGLCLWLRRHTGRRLGRVLLRPLHAVLAPDLRLLASGGAALDEAIANELEGLGWEVLSGYGLTETSPIVAFNGRGRARLGTVGQPLRGVEVRLEPVEGKPGGEIQVRGPNLFSGYRNDPEGTAEAFTSDGWFRTGDLGEFDEAGFLRILGRATETIILPGGKNVFPEEVEEAYAQSPIVREVAILERDRALAALVVPEAEALGAAGKKGVKTALLRELRRISYELPSHQRISDFAVTEQALPRTTLGKLRRHLLPELYEEARAGPQAEAEEETEPAPADARLLEHEVARRVWRTLERRYPDKRLSLEASPQVDLGIDSLEWVALGLDLQEEQGIRLNEEAIARIGTVRDLLEEAIRGSEAGPAEQTPEALDPAQLRWLSRPGPVVDLITRALFVLNRAIFRLIFGLRVTGRERLPEAGPFVLAPNHTSFLDPFAVTAALPWDRARAAYFAGITRYLFAGPLHRAFSRLAHVFPVDPERSPATSLALAEQVLERRNILVWFPEGARSPDGQLQPFMAGTARLARRSRAPFVPVRIAGTFEAWPKARRLPRRRRVSVTFGAPVDHDELFPPGAEGADTALGTLRERLQALAPAPAVDSNKRTNV